MSLSLLEYHERLPEHDRAICERLRALITAGLPDAENKVWHAHPVWFLKGNPIVGYSKQQKGIRLMFWSGADFAPSTLEVTKGKFKDASIFYETVEDIDDAAVQSWLAQSRVIQWDYKNIVQRKGQLLRLEVGKGRDD